jgi:hypothetical protein
MKCQSLEYRCPQIQRHNSCADSFSEHNACRQNPQDSGNVAQQKCQVAEGSNGAVLALNAKGQSTSVVPKSLSSPGLSKCAKGYPWQQQLSLPSKSFLSQFLKNCKYFTRASTQRNNLGSEMCAKRSSDGNGAVCGIMTTHWYYRRARFQTGRDRWHCCHLAASLRVLVVNMS